MAQRIQVRVSDEEMLDLQGRAEAVDKTVSAYCREKIFGGYGKSAEVAKEVSAAVSVVQEQVKKIKPVRTSNGMCTRCTRMGVASCGPCIEAARKGKESAVDVFGHLE